MKFNCPTCDATITTPAEVAGSVVSCPECSQPITIPAAEQEYADISGPSRLGMFIGIGTALIVAVLAFGAFVVWAKSGPRKQPEKVVQSSAKQTPRGNAPAGVRESPPELDAETADKILGFRPIKFVYVVGGFLLFALWLLMLIWIVRDTRNRSVDSGVLWMIVVIFTGFIGLLVYLASRPHGNLVLCENCMNKRLDYVRTCPHCGRRTNAHSHRPRESF